MDVAVSFFRGLRRHAVFRKLIENINTNFNGIYQFVFSIPGMNVYTMDFNLYKKNQDLKFTGKFPIKLPRVSTGTVFYVSRVKNPGHCKIWYPGLGVLNRWKFSQGKKPVFFRTFKKKRSRK